MSNGYIVVVYESIKDDNALKNYAEKARSAVEKYGGKFLVRGGKKNSYRGQRIYKNSCSGIFFI